MAWLAHVGAVDAQLTELLLVAVGLGVAAGGLSTAAGFGGGIILTLGLGLVVGPVQALTIAAPALLLGHLHRAASMRRAVDWKTAGQFSLGAIPGAVLGGIALVTMPPAAVWWILGGAALFAVAESVGWVPARFGRRAVVPGGGAVGFLASSAGVGGILLPPVLLGADLRGPTFVATAAVGAIAVQLARVGAYASAGILRSDEVWLAAGVAGGIFVGNIFGRRLLRLMTPYRQRRLAHLTLAATILVAGYSLVHS